LKKSNEEHVMSELHHRYDRAAVSDRIEQPPFAELVARGRSRARRVRTVRLAGVGVLAALAAAPLVALPDGNGPTVPAPSSPPPVEVVQPRASFAFFLDLDHGLVQYVDAECEASMIRITHDGGATWSEAREVPTDPDYRRPTPLPAEPGCFHPMVLQIAPDTLVAPLQRSFTDGPNLMSRDAGLTWREYEPQVRTAESVPDGVVPMWPCVRDACSQAGLGWFDPQTGDWLVLENQHPDVGHGLTAGLDGSLWVYGPGPDGSDLRLAVSRDRGRSWLEQHSFPDIDRLDASILVPYDGATAYLATMAPTVYPDPFHLYRTTDGGETWQPVLAGQQFEDVVDMWVNAAGGLVVTRSVGDSYETYISTDGGDTFTSFDLPVVGVVAFHGGFSGFASDPAAAASGYLSEDGLIWRPVQIPRWPDDWPDPSASVS
jgi:hypothetical protein